MNVALSQSSFLEYNTGIREIVVEVSAKFEYKAQEIDKTSGDNLCVSK